MNIAIITARGGSKRIPRKNIRPFLGKPVIAWPIEAARASGCFDRVLVSADDSEIAEVAQAYGGQEPFMRPLNLADDFTHAHVAARHALEWALREWGPIHAFCHLYSTAPFLTADHIKEGVKHINAGATNVYAMQRIGFPIYQALVMDDAGGLAPLFEPEKADMRSQDMPLGYIDAGQMYWFRTEYFFEHGTAIGRGTRLVELARESAIDLDTEDDWVFAEKLARLCLEKKFCVS